MCPTLRKTPAPSRQYAFFISGLRDQPGPVPGKRQARAEGLSRTAAVPKQAWTLAFGNTSFLFPGIPKPNGFLSSRPPAEILP